MSLLGEKDTLIIDDEMVYYQGMYFERSLKAKLLSFIRHFPVVAVTGARQVGKSTFLQETVGNHYQVVTFDSFVDIGSAKRDPELFLRSRAAPLILDEIQYVPELIPVLKRVVDEQKKAGQYVLTGSQQWEVMRFLSESLAGRVVFLDLEGFSFAESQNKGCSDSWLQSWVMEAHDAKAWQSKGLPRLNMKGAPFEPIWRGFFPQVQFLPKEMVSPFFDGYLRTYIERDARAFAELANWDLFSRFFRLCAGLTGQEVNYSHLGRDLGLTAQTARRWLQIFKATFQWFEVPPFFLNTTKRLSQKPKGYFADTGLACFAQSISSPEALSNHPLWGHIFETAIAAELRKQCALMSMRPLMSHWRSHAGAEVDFILELDARVYPIEVKAKSHPTRSDCSGITAFRKTFPGLNIQTGLIIAPANESYFVTEQELVVPFDLLMKNAQPILALDP